MKKTTNLTAAALAVAVATGASFGFDHPDKILVLFDDSLSHRIYSYFVVNDNIGQIVSINPVGAVDSSDPTELS